jgi:hypothetical protein
LAVVKLLQQLGKILKISVVVNQAFGSSSAFVSEIERRLEAHAEKNEVLIELLNVLDSVFTSCLDPTKFVDEHKMQKVLKRFAAEESAVLVRIKAEQLLRKIEDKCRMFTKTRQARIASMTGDEPLSPTISNASSTTPNFKDAKESSAAVAVSAKDKTNSTNSATSAANSKDSTTTSKDSATNSKDSTTTNSNVSSNGAASPRSPHNSGPVTAEKKETANSKSGSESETPKVQEGAVQQALIKMGIQGYSLNALSPRGYSTI